MHPAVIRTHVSSTDQQQLVIGDGLLESGADPFPILDEQGSGQLEATGFGSESRGKALDHGAEIDAVGMLRELRE